MDWSSLLRNPWKLVAIISIFIIGLILIFHNSTSDTKCSELLNQVDSNAPDLRLWPNARVPYKINPELDTRTQQLIRKAIKGIEDKTCIRFIDKVSTTERNWINFVRHDQSCLYPETIGISDNNERKGQDIVISADCLSSGQIQRYLGLTLGLGFEETRPDRDSYVRYSPELPGCLAGISKLPKISKFHHPAALNIFFDYYSHMFIDTKCFKAVGQRQYFNDSSSSFGMRLAPNQSDSLKFGSSDADYGGTFSVLDIEKLNAIYNCSGCHSYRFRPIHELTDNVEPFEFFKPVKAGRDYEREPLYICRVYNHGSLLTGRLSVVNDHGYVCWTSDTNPINTTDSVEERHGHLFIQHFEVLTNPESSELSWTQIDGNSSLPTNAIIGGMTSSRRQFYIGRCSLKVFYSESRNTTVIPGFVFPGDTTASVVDIYVRQQHCSPVEVLFCKE